MGDKQIEPRLFGVSTILECRAQRRTLSVFVTIIKAKDLCFLVMLSDTAADSFVGGRTAVRRAF